MPGAPQIRTLIPQGKREREFFPPIFVPEPSQTEASLSLYSWFFYIHYLGEKHHYQHQLQERRPAQLFSC